MSTTTTAKAEAEARAEVRREVAQRAVQALVDCWEREQDLEYLREALLEWVDGTVTGVVVCVDLAAVLLDAARKAEKRL